MRPIRLWYCSIGVPMFSLTYFRTFISEIEEVTNACVLAREQKWDVSVRRPLVIDIAEERFKAHVDKLRSTVATRRYTLWIGNIHCIVSWGIVLTLKWMKAELTWSSGWKWDFYDGGVGSKPVGSNFFRFMLDKLEQLHFDSTIV